MLDGHHDAGDPTGPVGSALGKIIRALPEPVAAQAEAVPVAELEEHLAVGWEYEAEVVIEASAGKAAGWLPRALGRVEPVDAATSRLVGSTGNPWWYAGQLAVLPAPFRIVGCPELQATARTVGRRLLAAGDVP